MKKVILNIKKYGIFRSLIIIASKYFGISIMKLHYLRLYTNIDIVNEKLKGCDLKIRALNYEDFQNGNKTVFNETKMKIYKDRFLDSSYFVYGIFEDNKLVYSTWLSTKQLGLPLVHSSYYLESNEGLLEDSFCDPIARGKGYHSIMNMYRIKKLYEMGRNRVIAIVLDGNIPAMKVQIKSGFVDLGVFYIIKIFGMKFCTLNKRKYDNK